MNMGRLILSGLDYCNFSDSPALFLLKGFGDQFHSVYLGENFVLEFFSNHQSL